MISNSKLALVAALAVISLSTPVSAQSFTKGDGTGNVLSFTYGPGGIKPASPVPVESAQNLPARQTVTEHVAVRQSGRNSFAAIGTSGFYNSAVVPFAGNSEAPAITGGGSAGYNQMLKNY